MDLPIKPLPTDTFQIGDASVKYRSLSRSEAIDLGTQFVGKVADAEVFVLSRGLGVTEEEAAKWRNTTDTQTVGDLLEAILHLSGMGGEDDPK